VTPRPVALLTLLLAWEGPACAEVYQCVHADGRVLLTDAGCPPEFVARLVVADPAPGAAPPAAAASADPAEVTEREALAAAQAQRRAAEAEAARLRAELEAERQGSNAMRLDALDRKVDALLERPEVYGGVAVVPVPALPWCGAGAGRPWVDCRPRQPHSKPRADAPEPRDRCGIFGCTPGITYAPWDDERRAPN
jgi:hypothetical protein